MKRSGGTQVIDSTYNSFTRAGTLLHVMLARSAGKNQLAPLLADFLGRNLTDGHWSSSYKFQNRNARTSRFGPIFHTRPTRGSIELRKIISVS